MAPLGQAECDCSLTQAAGVYNIYYVVLVEHYVGSTVSACAIKVLSGASKSSSKGPEQAEVMAGGRVVHTLG